MKRVSIPVSDLVEGDRIFTHAPPRMVTDKVTSIGRFSKSATIADDATGALHRHVGHLHVATLGEAASGCYSTCSMVDVAR